MSETHYDELKPYFGQEKIQLQYIDTDAFVFRVKTKDIIKDSKNLENIFDFSKIDGNHEIFLEKKVIGKFKIETPKKFGLLILFV